MGTLQKFESSDVIGVTQARVLLKQRALQPPIGTPDLETLAAAEVWVCARTVSGTDNQRVVGARRRALLSVNQEQIRLYHDIGQSYWIAKGARGGEPGSSIVCRRI
jgi:hypothetical protein